MWMPLSRSSYNMSEASTSYELRVVPYEGGALEGGAEEAGAEAGAEDGTSEPDAEPSCRDGLDGASVGVPECLATTDSWDAGA